MTARGRALVLGTALLLRLAAVAVSAREVADVQRYRKVADHVLDVSWNPYEAPRLYPYPPVWVWVEVAAAWLSRTAGLSFAVLVKLPVVLADVLIVDWLWRRGSRLGARGAAWAYALHPVSLLVSGFHGQFDAVALLFVVWALSSWLDGHADRAALCLAAAIGLKPFPVLLLPLFLLIPRPRGALPEAQPLATRARLRFVALALGPVALILLPYLVHDARAVVRELAGYGGIADFGWIGLTRGLRWLLTGVLVRSEATLWTEQVTAAKLLFLAAEAALLVALARGRLAWPLTVAAQAVLLAFLVFYGALSAQYLLWAIPLGVLLPGPYLLAYSVTATVALLGFYPFLAPGVLFPPLAPAWLDRSAAGAAWVVGVAGTLVAAGAWLTSLVRRGARA